MRIDSSTLARSPPAARAASSLWRVKALPSDRQKIAEECPKTPQGLQLGPQDKTNLGFNLRTSNQDLQTTELGQVPSWHILARNP